MTPDDPEALAAAAAELAQQPVVAIARAGNGANSQTFRVSLASHVLALKVYPERHGDRRDRLNTEWNALSLLRARGIDAVPAPIARDDRRGLMLMEWLVGDPVVAHRDADLDDAIAFMVRVMGLSNDSRATPFGLASEACLSATEIVRQIEARLAALASHPYLDRFLRETFLVAYAEAKHALASELRQSKVLPEKRRRLIPADFGFHNAMRHANGTLRYIDFDYFGWDDPVKLATDFILHPSMTLSSHDRQKVRTGIATALADDSDFAARLDRHLGLYALRWALILLNSFRRDRIGLLADDPKEREARFITQLRKADALVVASSARYAEL
jgi:hypothetical protein